MGRHSLASADAAWIDILAEMNQKRDNDCAAVPLTAAAFMRREWWEDIPGKRRPSSHAKPGISSRLLLSLWWFCWELLGDLHEATTAFVDGSTFLSTPRWSIASTSVRASARRALVTTPAARVQALTDDARALKDAVARRARARAAISGAFVRHVTVLSLLVALVRPTQVNSLPDEPEEVSRQWPGTTSSSSSSFSPSPR